MRSEPTRERITLATVVFPEPEPPANPITSGLSFVGMAELYPKKNGERDREETGATYADPFRPASQQTGIEVGSRRGVVSNEGQKKRPASSQAVPRRET